MSEEVSEYRLFIFSSSEIQEISEFSTFQQFISNYVREFNHSSGKKIKEPESQFVSNLRKNGKKGNESWNPTLAPFKKGERCQACYV